MTTDVSTSAPAPDRTVAAALAGSAAASAVVPPDETGPATDATLAEAARAWRWVVGTEALDLYAVPDASPHWQATCIAAGGALHRARVALAAEGLQAHVTLLPELPERAVHNGAADRARVPLPGRGRNGAPVTRHLARVVVTGTVEVTDEARELYAATETDWLPRPAEPVLERDDRVADDTGRIADDDARAANNDARAASNGSAGPGRLRSVLSSRSVARELVKAARAEGVRLRLIRDGDEYIGVMHGPDTGEAWLRAGMACSAVRLLARRLGLRAVISVAGDDHAPPVPASPARPDRPPRLGRRLIGDREGWLNVGIGTPYLRLRIAPVPD
jgi:hypothetical protein